MTLQQQELALQALDQDAEVIAEFVAALDFCRLQMIGTAIHEELSMRYQGKPGDKAMLH